MPFPTGWSYYKVGTIDHNYVGSTLTDFPLLARKASDSDINSHALGNGNDIRFSDDSGSPTEYPFGHIGSFSAGNLLEYLKIPSVSHVADTTFRVWYGNAGASDGQQKSNVPDSNTKLFMPLEEDPLGSAPQMLDWTSNANNGTCGTGSGALAQAAGEVGNGVDFHSASQGQIVCGSTNIPNSSAGGITLSCWVKLSATGTYDIFIWSANVGLGMFGGNPQLIHGDASPVGANLATNLADSAWHQVTGTWDGTHSKLYLDGSLVNTDGGAQGNYGYGANTAALLGTGYVGESPQGILDESTIANTAHSADWIYLEYQNKVNNRVSWGSELSTGGTTTTTTTTTPIPCPVQQLTINPVVPATKHTVVSPVQQLTISCVIPSTKHATTAAVQQLHVNPVTLSTIHTSALTAKQITVSTVVGGTTHTANIRQQLTVSGVVPATVKRTTVTPDTIIINPITPSTGGIVVTFSPCQLTISTVGASPKKTAAAPVQQLTISPLIPSTLKSTTAPLCVFYVYPIVGDRPEYSTRIIVNVTDTRLVINVDATRKSLEGS